MRWLLIGCIFLLSGAAGLIYEIVWFRKLAITFGGTGPAVAATTAAFMAGLGLGSFLAGRRADRLQRPLSAFAGLESLIAVSAACLPFAINGVEDVMLGIFGSAESTPQANGFLFVAVFLVLIVPTALMGATLPVLCCALRQSDGRLGRGFTWLYGLNTLGACAGAVAAGFWLIPTLGITSTARCAMIMNVTAAASAAALGWFLKPPIAPADRPGVIRSMELPANGRRERRLIHGAVFVSGFASLAAQYLWVRCLLFGFDRLKNTTYSFSAVLGVTLAGLVVGSAIAYGVVDRVRNPVRVFAASLSLLGLTMVVSVWQLFTLPKLVDTIDPVTLQVDFFQAVFDVVVRTMLVTGASTVLMGFTLPLAVRSAAQLRAIGASVGAVYGWNTLGSVGGAVCAAWLITPTLGLTRGLIAIGLLPVAAGFVVWFAESRSARRITVAVTFGIVAILFPLDPLDWSLQSLRDQEKLLRYIDGPMASVAVIQAADQSRRICVDDVPVAGTSDIMQTDQKSLAHWSVMLSANPRRALTVGFGSGGASWSFLLHDRLESVHCVEICPNVPQGADLLRDANHGLLDARDPRYRLIIADARAYLRSTPGQYDMVVSDCTDLRYRSSANLYDLEYFRLCHDALREGGCTVIWMPLGGLQPESFLLTLRTFARVYPNAGVFYLHNRWTHYVLLVGHRGEFLIEPARVRAMLQEPDVRADMEQIGMTIPEKVIATYLTSARELRWLIDGEELNTEDMPRLEFAVPRYDTGPWSAQRNLNMLRKRPGDVRTWLAPETPAEEVESVQRFSIAFHHILQAQEAERSFEIEEATRQYLLAQQQTPDDPAIQRALEFPGLQELLNRNAPVAWLLKGRSLQLQGRTTEAADCFARYRTAGLDLRGTTDPVEMEWLRQAAAWEQTASDWQRELRQSTSPGN